MKQPSTAPVSRLQARRADASLIEEILAGLTASPKHLHPKFLYDARGSVLFDRICELPEYYLTRTETKILRQQARGFMRALGDDPAIIELGSGSSLKTRILLDALTGPATYVPVEISRSHLNMAADDLKRRYPHLRVLPVCADFTHPFSLPRSIESQRRLVFFPGSTLGNYYRDEAVELLRLMGRLAGPDGQVLVGADLRKDAGIVEPAYNDAAGVTAAFNLNVLTRLNKEFDADFDVNAFEHRAPWVAAESRIEMHLVSHRAQTVRIGEQTIELAQGESIWTESCHKYDCEQFAALAAAAGLAVDEVWTDPERLFSVQRLSNIPTG
jgi:dimethylhistidine N-methyltransferase